MCKSFLCQKSRIRSWPERLFPICLDPSPQPKYTGNLFYWQPPRKGGDNPGAEEGAGGGQQAAEDLQGQRADGGRY